MLNYITVSGFYFYPSLFWPSAIIAFCILWLIYLLVFRKGEPMVPVIIIIVVGMLGMGLIAGTTTAYHDTMLIENYEVAHTRTTVTLVLNGESTVFDDVNTYRALLFPERYNLYWLIDMNAYGIEINSRELLIDVNPEWQEKDQPIEQYVQSEYAQKLRSELDSLNIKVNVERN